jgi:hypothetical protein
LREALGSNLHRVTDCLTVGYRGVPLSFQADGGMLLDYATAYFLSKQSVTINVQFDASNLKQTTAA